MAAAAWFFDTSGLLSALVPAVVIHELGHVVALRCFGARLGALFLDGSGLRLDYRGVLSPMQEVLSALAGPAAGLLYALAAAWAGRVLKSEFFLCSAGLSLVLSAFNLLPALPLDGGRALWFALRLRGLTQGCTLLTGTALLAWGVWGLLRGQGPGIALAGSWILWYWGTGTIPS